MDTILTLEMPGASNPGINLLKRKWNAADVPEGSALGLSLELALGQRPPSSNVKTSSATSSFDGDMSVIENMGGSIYIPASNPIPKKAALFAKPAPSNNLLLTLYSGAAASVITNASLFHQQGNSVDSTMSFDTCALFDEGSASSLLKSGTSVLSFGAADTGEVSLNRWINLNKTSSADTLSNFTMMMRPTTCTSGISKTRRCPSTKTCQFQGCTKGARGASGFCIAHGGGRRCQRPGCGKGAEGRTVFCKAHGGGRRCQHLGCTKSAEGRTDYCIAHGGGRRCGHDGCPHAARGKSGRCIKHGGGKRCQKEGCMRSAEGLSGLCISHGGGRRCQYPDCTKGAQGSTMFCKAHGGGKRCTAVGCGKGAEGSTPFCKAHGGGKRCSFQGGGICPKSVHGGTLFCVAHGGGKRCAHVGCGRSARGRTDFCVRHGGGKRCKAEGCKKSAQGRTDFCKAHGGGTRCSWGHPGSGRGSGDPPCDKFARGRTGLCTSHSAAVHDHRVHGAETLEWAGYKNADAKTSKGTAAAANGLAKTGCWNGFIASDSHAVALSEGRVHGGGLMAMLASRAALGGQQFIGVGDKGAPEWLGSGRVGMM